MAFFFFKDDKLQNVLGHFQKDFEGGVSAENLGKMFGGYGSFLLGDESSIWLHPKTSQNISNSPRSPNHLQLKGSSWMSKPAPSVPQTRHRGASCGPNALNTPAMTSDNVSVKRDPCLSSNQVGHKFNLRDENPSQSSNIPDQRSLKFRIKVGSDSMAHKNEAIYSGLGLGDSPPLSSGNCLNEGSDMLLESFEADGSPTSIVQAMTSFPVPGSSLISPLHDSLLCICKREGLSRSAQPIIVLKSNKKCPGPSVDQSISGWNLVGREMEKTNVSGKIEPAVEMKSGNAMKNLEDHSEAKDTKYNRSRAVALSDTLCARDPVMGPGLASLLSEETNEDELRNKLLPSDILKEESLESILAPISCKVQKGDADAFSSKKSLKRAVNNKDSLTKQRKLVSIKYVKSTVPFKPCVDDLEAGALLKLSQEATSQVEKGTSRKEGIEAVKLGGKKKKLVEGKKQLHQTESHRNPSAVIKKERFDAVSVTAPNPTVNIDLDVRGRSNTVHKFSPKKNIDKTRKNQRAAVHNRAGPMDHSSSLPSLFRLNNSSINTVEAEQSAKLKESSSVKRVDKLRMSGLSVNGVSHVGPQDNVVTEVFPPASGATPVIVKEDWVACDECETWRLLPFGRKPEDLPDKWTCSMLDWLPGMNSCDISAEMTNTFNQIDPQNPGYGVASGSNTANQGNSQNHLTLDSLAMSSEGKEKQVVKETAKARSNHGFIEKSTSAKSRLLDSVNSRSLNDMCQPVAELSLANRYSSHHMSESGNLVVGTSTANLKCSEAAESKLINKSESDHTPGRKCKKLRIDDIAAERRCKKSRTEDIAAHRGLSVDLGRASLGTKAVPNIKDGAKQIKLSKECAYARDVKSDSQERLSGSVKVGHQAQISPDGGSLNARIPDRAENRLKKRKLKEWQETRLRAVTNSGAEESSGSKLNKEKKLRKRVAREPGTKTVQDKLSKEGGVPIVYQGVDDDPVHVFEEVKDIDKGALLLKKQRRKVDSSRNNVVSAQVAMTTNSSSSKVLDSCKTIATSDDFKGSPVESVSSSPYKAMLQEKLGMARGGNLGKDNAVNGRTFFAEVNRCGDLCGDGELSEAGVTSMEKASGSFHSQPLKYFPSDHRDGHANHRVGGKTKSSTVPVGNSVSMEQQHCCSSELLDAKNIHDVNREKQNNRGYTLLRIKTGNGSSSLVKVRTNASTSGFVKDKVKASDVPSEQWPKSSSLARKRKQDSPDNSGDEPSKSEDNAKRSSSVGRCSRDSRLRLQLNTGECNDSDAKLDTPLGKNGNVSPLINSDDDNKRGSTREDSRNRILKVLPFAEGKGKPRSQGHESVLGSQQTGELHVLSSQASEKGDMSKALQQHPGNPGNKGEACQSLKQLPSAFREARGHSAKSPLKTKSSSQTASDALEKAQKQRDCADRMKSSGFDLESREAYFQAALAFLHGAFLLEASCSEGGQHGEMTAMQVYSSTAKLFESCAFEYEKQNEMAAAALAYKGMEVAYFRAVSCKSSSLTKDRNELHGFLQTTIQGDSPSSSASDVDNLSTHVTVDKAPLSKGTLPHVVGNPTVVPRNHASLARLINFTQDMGSAMEAARKYQNAFIAFSSASEVSPKTELISSVKGVLDFSFQDVERLIELLRLAMEAINRSGLDNTKKIK
ncbi:unnamed protein product [Linum tenue]|uniref:CW-type domain-containing protein n=1 Tax=Linum tenue TaxID=586396 RepID=A0AAV0PAP7_9ROSI|nr:unnamed protein product [Linum tenue]